MDSGECFHADDPLRVQNPTHNTPCLIMPTPTSTSEISTLLDLSSGKVVAVTGASSGIGEATARHLAAQGARVVLGARRMDRLEAIAREIEAGGGHAHVAALDVAERDQVDAFIASAQDAFGRVDALVSNAGIMPLSRLDALQVEEWDRMIDVNFRGILYGIAAALPAFQAQGHGHFVHVSSVADRWIGPTSAVYSATKYAVRAVSEGLRQEVGDAARVTVIAPGAIETELPNSISDPELRQQAIETFRQAMLPPEAIARAIAYALDQPADVDVSEIVVRPIAQSF